MKKTSLTSARNAVLGAAALLLAAGSPALAQQTPNDLIQDHPTAVASAWASAKATVLKAAGMLGTAVGKVMPTATPGNLVQSNGREDSSDLFRLLGVSGYKLKEIDNAVGIIPEITFTFSMVRELSEADYDFLDEQLELFRVRSPGFYAELQRAIIRTIVAINSATEMQVTDLKLTVLPLPAASFVITPTETVFGEETSAIMRAIQRIDRRVRAIPMAEARPGQTATPPTR